MKARAKSISPLVKRGLALERTANAAKRLRFAWLSAMGGLAVCVPLFTAAAPLHVQPGTVVVHVFFPASAQRLEPGSINLAARCRNRVSSGVVQKTDCVGR